MRRLLLAALFVLGLGAFSWLDRGPLLEGVANLWIISDPLRPADAAVVLGGGISDRPFAAARYYQAGLVNKVLVARPGEGPAVKLGVVTSDAEAARQILLRLGVPGDAIETFGSDLKNTHEEVAALYDWAVAHKARRFIVPTEIFSTRRVRWMLHRAFGDTAEIFVPALEPAEYHRGDWWQKDQGILAFQNEVIKYLYYNIKY